uniref:Uncharacterized protein n=1 Tax=Meloidogyne javanica TaxID=6303 RepID=A0A915M3T0_MELJA
MNEVDYVSATMNEKKNNVGEKSNQVFSQGEEGMDDLTEEYDDSDEDDEDYDDMDDDNVYNNYDNTQMDDIDSLEAYEELPRMDNYGEMAEEKEVMSEMNMNDGEEPKQDSSMDTQTINEADQVVSPMSDAPSQKMEQAPQAVKTGANQKEVETKEVKQKEIKPKDAKAKEVKPKDGKQKDAKSKDAKPKDAKPKDTKPKDAKPKNAKPKVADKHKAPAPPKPKKGIKDTKTAKSPISKTKGTWPSKMTNLAISIDKKCENIGENKGSGENALCIIVRLFAFCLAIDNQFRSNEGKLLKYFRNIDVLYVEWIRESTNSILNYFNLKEIKKVIETLIEEYNQFFEIVEKNPYINPIAGRLNKENQKKIKNEEKEIENLEKNNLNKCKGNNSIVLN